MKSWPTKPLGELVAIQKGKKASELFSAPTKTSVRYLQIEDLRPEANIKYCEPFDCTKVTAADAIIAWDGANAGTVSCNLEGYIGSTLAALRPKEILSAKFLSRFLEGNFDYLQQTANGATIPHISKDALTSLEIPVPPLAEQERIVQLLDEADALRKLRAQADRRTAGFIPALFHKMFGKISKRDTMPLGEIVSFGNGATPPKANEEFWDGKTPWVSPKDMKIEEIFDAEDHVSAAAFEKTNLQLIPKDTVLVVVRGMILAHTVPICLCRVPVAINQDMKALLPKNEIAPEFLHCALQVQHAHILNQVTTAAHGTKKLDSDRLKSVLIPAPPLPLQKEFAERVKEIRALETAQARSRARLDALFASLLDRAFKGEL